MVRVDRQQRRVYVLNRRLHHGDTGLLLIALGFCLAVHDRADRRSWLRFSRL